MDRVVSIIKDRLTVVGCEKRNDNREAVSRYDTMVETENRIGDSYFVFVKNPEKLRLASHHEYQLTQHFGRG